MINVFCPRMFLTHAKQFELSYKTVIITNWYVTAFLFMTNCCAFHFIRSNVFAFKSMHKLKGENLEYFCRFRSYIFFLPCESRFRITPACHAAVHTYLGVTSVSNPWLIVAWIVWSRSHMWRTWGLGGGGLQWIQGCITWFPVYWCWCAVMFAAAAELYLPSASLHWCTNPPALCTAPAPMWFVLCIPHHPYMLPYITLLVQSSLSSLSSFSQH